MVITVILCLVSFGVGRFWGLHLAVIRLVRGGRKSTYRTVMGK